MFSQNRRKSLIAAVVLALLAGGAMGCWLERQIFWPGTPDNYVFLQHLEQAHINLSGGNIDGVVAELNEALRIRPDSLYVRLKLAFFFKNLGEYSESIDCYRTGLQYQPDSVKLLDNLAWLLFSCPDASLRNGTEAVLRAERLCRVTDYRNPTYVATLAAAYAEAGRFSDAIAMAKKAHELAAAKDDPASPGEPTDELEALFQEHKTFGQIVDLQIPADRAPFAQLNFYTQHEMFMREASTGKVDLLFLGDSITEHWRYQGSNLWNNYYAPRHAANFAIGGERTPGVLWQVKHGELANIKPKVIVLLIGTNQTGSDGPDKIANDIEALIEEIRTTCPNSKVLLLAIFPRRHSGDLPAQMDCIQKVNATIAGLDDGKRIRFLNINDRFLGPDGNVSAVLMPDFLHPGEKGYQVWAGAMEPTLSEMLK